MKRAKDHSDDDAAQAAEYALHLMEPLERADFEARLESEPALRDLLRDWDEALGGLADGFDEVVPPAALKTRIAAQFGDETANPTDLAHPTRALRGRGMGLSLWRLVGGLAVGAAVVLALVLLLPSQAPPDGPVYQTRIDGAGAGLTLTARLEAASGELALAGLTADAAPPGRVLEAWLIPPGAADPVSLGVVPLMHDSARLRVPDALLARLDGATVALSVEPPGGSPTGAPTGPVVAAGTLTRL